MANGKRPISVTIISVVYIVMGTVGFVYHLGDLRAHSTELGGLGIEFVRVLALVAGIFMLRAANWARWLALLWMAFHVGIGYLHGWVQMVTHAVFLAVIAVLLRRRRANEYFTANHPTPPKEG